MARCVQSGLEYAIKFFISAAAFEYEQAMYLQIGASQVGRGSALLPKVRFLQLHLQCAS